MNRLMPWTLASSGCSLRMMSLALVFRWSSGFRSDVSQFRQCRKLLRQLRRPEAQLGWIGVFQAVLKLRAAHAILHGQVLDRLHEQIDALDLGQLRLQPANDVAGVGLSLVERLQI